MDSKTKAKEDYVNNYEQRPESEDTFADLEPLEDLDDAEFGLPPVDQPPNLEDILAAVDNEDLDEFLEDESCVDSSAEGNILVREGGNYSTSYDGNQSGSSSVGGGSTSSGKGALFRHLGVFSGNEETLSVHSRGSQSLGQASETGSIQSSVLLHNKRKLERSKASIMR